MGTLLTPTNNRPRTNNEIIGGFTYQLVSSYPHFKFTVQDRAEVIQQAKDTFWPEKAPQHLQSGAVTLQTHDFFQANPIKDADVYWYRAIL